MPRRTDIQSILIIGSGPIVIGQGCEFDYSGVQACRAIKEEGYRVVLINSNPATIMTDPEFADATYIEPITPEGVEKILQREAEGPNPIDAVLPTLGGQTGLNTAMACYDRGIFTRYGVTMIGAARQAIFRGEDRQEFKNLMISIGLKVPRSGVVHNMDEARKILEDIGLPLIIRPAFTLGGTGGGIAYNREEFEMIVARGLDASPVTEVLIEQSVLGWKEYEMEVMRDKNDNAVIICSIENVDPMGVHTGDSITVAPIQTLTDKEYQRMRDASIAVIRAVGVETGGSNIQFAIDPSNGEMVVVEMNPRVSRSSALASKATGYPIAKLAAKLAIGYTLDELANDITSIRRVEGTGVKIDPKDPRSRYSQYTSACFEPTIDYCVIKIPRWTFEKFPDADETLTTQMKSVGEAMAIGRTFKEALQKGIRSMEVKRFGFGLDRYDKWLHAQKEGTESRGSEGTKVEAPPLPTSTRDEDFTADNSDKTTQGESLDHEWPIPEAKLRRKLAVPSQGRLYYIRYAMKMGWTIDQIYELTKIDRWFLAEMKELVDFEDRLFAFASAYRAKGMDPRAGSGPEHWAAIFREAKQLGYSDVQLGNALGSDADTVRTLRRAVLFGEVHPVYKLVDTCAAEFEAYTPYYYSTYEQPYTVNGKPQVEDEIRLSDKEKVIIIGGGPNRIGQGIEFDYCCVQAAFAMKELGFESVMINSNPETVSTDYDTSDLLFFEPLTHEDVLNICERLNGGPFKTADQSAIGNRQSAITGNSQLATGNLVKGVIVQFGGQTPLNLAKGLKEAGVPILGTTVESLDAAGDREQFRQLLADLGLRQPTNGIARNAAEAREIAKNIGYPVLVRPSFVLGGRAMEIVYDEPQLNYYMTHAVEAAGTGAEQKLENPILIDRFLDNAIEVDVDCLADFSPKAGTALGVNLEDLERLADKAASLREEMASGATDRATLEKLKRSLLEIEAKFAAHGLQPETAAAIRDALKGEPEFAGATKAFEAKHGAVTVDPDPGRAIVIGVMEHIEEAGIHSGDSACALPPYSLGADMVRRLKEQTRALAKALRVRGLMNVQYAIKDGEIYVIEVNPRASRTVPFVSKATGVPWAKIAAMVMAGKTLAELGVVAEHPDPDHISVKEVVFPFSKFPGVDVILGPEMRSTGEVMGIDKTFPLAYAKAQIASGGALPTKGRVYISVNSREKHEVPPIARQLVDCGFELIATEGTWREIHAAGVPATRIPKLSEGRPNIADFIKNQQVQLIINTPTRKGPKTDEGKIRAMAVLHKVTMITTITGARAAAQAIRALQQGEWGVRPLQDYFPAYREASEKHAPHS